VIKKELKSAEQENVINKYQKGVEKIDN